MSRAIKVFKSSQDLLRAINGYQEMSRVIKNFKSRRDLSRNVNSYQGFQGQSRFNMKCQELSRFSIVIKVFKSSQDFQELLRAVKSFRVFEIYRELKRAAKQIAKNLRGKR